MILIQGLIKHYVSGIANMATLNEFISQVAGEGLMRSNRFAVSFSLPPGIGYGRYNQDLRKILLYCDNVNLPGLTIETTQAKTFGEIREMPYQKMFDNINMGFYVDNAMSVKLLFDAWMEAIQDPVTRTFNYYKDYTTDITIEVFDIANKVRYGVTLFQCYPKTLNPVQMDYAGKDVMKLSVSMNYKYWQSFAATSSGKSSASPSNATFGSGLLNGGLLGDSLRVPDTYFTNFDTFQTGFNSFEQGRASLFSSETASVGRGSILI
jgi:hypothetical protein